MGVEYVSRVPRPPLDGLIHDLYYLDGVPPYARLTLPPMPGALLIVNLGAPYVRGRRGAGNDARESHARLLRPQRENTASAGADPRLASADDLVLRVAVPSFP